MYYAYMLFLGLGLRLRLFDLGLRVYHSWTKLKEPNQIQTLECAAQETGVINDADIDD